MDTGGRCQRVDHVAIGSRQVLSGAFRRARRLAGDGDLILLRHRAEVALHHVCAVGPPVGNLECLRITRSCPGGGRSPGSCRQAMIRSAMMTILYPEAEVFSAPVRHDEPRFVRRDDGLGTVTQPELASQSSRSMGCCRASMSARSSSMTSRKTAGSSHEASQARPGPLQQPPGRSCPWWPRTAWIRLRSSVRSRTSCARCRSMARSWRTAGGATPRLRQQVGAQQLRQDRRTGPCRSSAAPRRSPCTAAGAPGAGRSRSLPAAPPASPSRTLPRTPPACQAASRRSRPGPDARRWARCGWPAPGRPGRSPPPETACGARRFRRRQTSRASFPSSNVTGKLRSPG